MKTAISRAAQRGKKYEAFAAIYWWLRSLGSERAVRAAVHELCRRYRVDMTAFCAELCMSWDELARLAGDPLVTIGAHTVKPRHAQEGDRRRGAIGDEDERLGDRGRAGHASAPSRLSGRRRQLGRRAASFAWRARSASIPP